MDVARYGPADAPALLIISSACHGVEGFCGSGVQIALLRRRGASTPRRAARRRGRALHPRAQPLRLLVVAAHHARERRPEPQLPRLRQPLPRNAGLRRAGPPDRAGRLAADARGRAPARPPTSPSTAPKALQAALSAAASTTIRRACSTAAATPPGASRRCAMCCRSTAARCRAAGLDRPAHRPGPQRPRRAHLRRPRRCRAPLPARAPGGASRSPRSTTARRPRPC